MIVWFRNSLLYIRWLPQQGIKVGKAKNGLSSLLQVTVSLTRAQDLKTIQECNRDGRRKQHGKPALWNEGGGK